MYAVRTRAPVPWCACRENPLTTYCGRRVARNWIKIPVLDIDPLSHSWCQACWQVVGHFLTRYAYAKRQGGPAIARRIAEAHGLLGPRPRPARHLARTPPPPEELTP